MRSSYSAASRSVDLEAGHSRPQRQVRRGRIGGVQADEAVRDLGDGCRRRSSVSRWRRASRARRSSTVKERTVQGCPDSVRRASMPGSVQSLGGCRWRASYCSSTLRPSGVSAASSARADRRAVPGLDLLPHGVERRHAAWRCTRSRRGGTVVAGGSAGSGSASTTSSPANWLVGRYRHRAHGHRSPAIVGIGSDSGRLYSYHDDAIEGDARSEGKFNGKRYESHSGCRGGPRRRRRSCWSAARTTRARSPASSTAAASGTGSSTQVSTSGNTEVKVEGQDLAGLDLNSVTCVKAAGKINVASAPIGGGAQGLGVVMTDEATPEGRVPGTGRRRQRAGRLRDGRHEDRLRGRQGRRQHLHHHR